MNKAQPDPADNENSEKALKHELQLNGMSLLIYPQGSKTSLLTALSESIHISEEHLLKQIVQHLEFGLQNQCLPRRLSYILQDKSIIEDYEKYPYLTKFMKISLEVFSELFEKKLRMFSLTNFNHSRQCLNALIVNENGYTDEVCIARINNKFYNTFRKQELVQKKESSKEKSCNQIDSEDYIKIVETFQNGGQVKDDDDAELGPIELKKIRSSIQPNQGLTFNKNNKNMQKMQNDNVSLGDRLQKRDDHYLIKECTENPSNYDNKSFVPTLHSNPQMMNQQMYYYMYPQQQNNYMPMYNMQMSPQKQTNSYKGATYYQNSPHKAQNMGNSSPTGDEEERFTGRLKFFDDSKNYGFIIMDADDSDIFVHYDDLHKAGISKDIIKSLKQNEIYMHIRFSFKVMEYFGKYKKSRKAIDLIIIQDPLNLVSNFNLLQPE